MPHQEPICVFVPKVRVAFDAYLNKQRASAKTLINTTKSA